MHLVVEREALPPGHAALLELDHLHAGAQQDHLAVLLVQEHHALHLLQPLRQQELRHLEVVQPGDERASVDERVEGRPRMLNTGGA